MMTPCCENCNNYKDTYCKHWKQPSPAYGHCYKYTPIRTKFDCIKDMNVNELANFLQGMCPPEFHPCPMENCNVKNCFVCWLDYLHSRD